jgi:hypothetical protein
MVMIPWWSPRAYPTSFEDILCHLPLMLPSVTKKIYGLGVGTLPQGISTQAVAVEQISYILLIVWDFYSCMPQFCILALSLNCLRPVSNLYRHHYENWNMSHQVDSGHSWSSALWPCLHYALPNVTQGTHLLGRTPSLCLCLGLFSLLIIKLR